MIFSINIRRDNGGINGSTNHPPFGGLPFVLVDINYLAKTVPSAKTIIFYMNLPHF